LEVGHFECLFDLFDNKVDGDKIASTPAGEGYVSAKLALVLLYECYVA
jgi:hypothetical protein